MLDIEKMVYSIGLDIDKKDKKYLEKIQDKSAYYGMIQTTDSKNGYHIKIKLNKPVKLKESLWIRYYLNDDKMRLLFDCLRIISDIDDIDVLWNIKEKKLLKDMMVNN